MEGSWVEGKIAWAKEFPGSETGFDIAIMNADGSGLRQLTNDPACDTEPAISPNGRYVVFYSSRSGNGDLYLMRSDGLPGTAQRVTPGPDPERHPTWSPDGSMIAYEARSQFNNSYQIFIQKIPGGTPVQVAFGTNGRSDPAWSPDGLWIAYDTNEFRGGTFDIAKVRPNGTGARIRVTTGNRRYTRSTRSPSGTTIAMEAGQINVGGSNPGFFDIRRVPSAGGPNTLLLHNDPVVDDIRPHWR